jgi:hypothetical protein
MPISGEVVPFCAKGALHRPIGLRGRVTRTSAVPESLAATTTRRPAPFWGEGQGEGDEPATTLEPPGGKARDFASPASPASLIAVNYCQQMVCVGDAKCAAARVTRHTCRVRVTKFVPSCRSYRVS